MERWNLGYDTLKEINPKLVMVRVTGFGQTGPYASRAGYGSIGEAMGGLRYVIGDPSTQPSRPGISLGDELAATYACLGAMMALHARERTGVGQVVDSAIYEAVLAMMESMVTEYNVAGYIRERTGPILPNVSPSNIFNTKDEKLLLIGANQDTVFARLAEAMGQPELATDPRYATHAARGEHQAELDGLIDDWTRTIDLAPLQDKLNDAGVPCGLIYTAPDMLEDPHFKARNAIVDVEHPDFGTIKMQNVAPRLSDTPGAVRHVGPELGEHTDEVLGEILNYSEDQIASWRDAGIV
jgi:formyl-CoA transferase